jgi:rhodanese-related sulfurtransferase
VAQHVVHKDIKTVQWHEIATLDPEKSVLLDVRDEDEREQGYIPESIHISLPELRQRFSELPRDKEIILYCQTGQRSYFACCYLAQIGFNVKNLTGAYRTWKVSQNGIS